MTAPLRAPLALPTPELPVKNTEFCVVIMRSFSEKLELKLRRGPSQSGSNGEIRQFVRSRFAPLFAS